MEGERKQKTHDSSSLAEDENYVAYKAQEDQLKQDYMGKWVAFFEGQLAVVADDQESLFTEAHKKGINSFFSHQIVEEEMVCHLRSPRIVRE